MTVRLPYSGVPESVNVAHSFEWVFLLPLQGVLINSAEVAEVINENL